MTITSTPPIGSHSSATAPLVQGTGVTLPPERLAQIKAAYTTRHVIDSLVTDPPALLTDLTLRPRAGDLVLARVAEIGKHTRLESPVSRRQAMFVGDEVLVAYGHRYAPDQFEAVVPDDLGPTDLVAGGGVAGRAISQHADIDAPTRLVPIGLLTRGGERVTLAQHAPYRVRAPRTAPVDPRIVVVAGTSMNSGKSATVASLVHGLKADGLRVAAGKATGTGAGNDPGIFTDAGAQTVLDFTDYGYPTTFRLAHDQIRALFSSLIEDLAATGPDAVVVEIADGLFQEETARLLADPILSVLADDVVFAAGDALGAAAGRSELQRLGLPVRAVSGLLTSSPLATREARSALDVPVVDTFELGEAHVTRSVLR